MVLKGIFGTVEEQPYFDIPSYLGIQCLDGLNNGYGNHGETLLVVPAGFIINTYNTNDNNYCGTYYTRLGTSVGFLI